VNFNESSETFETHRIYVYCTYNYILYIYIYMNMYNYTL